MIWTRFVLFTTFLSIVTPAYGQIGSIKEVIQDVYDKKEPKYVQDIAIELTKEIYKFVPDGIEARPKAKLTWYLTMLKVVSAAFQQARKAAGDVKITIGRNREWAIRKAEDEAKKSAWFMSFERMLETNHKASLGSKELDHACYHAAFTAVRETFSMEGHKPEILQMTAEWGALNWLLQNIAAIIPQNYRAIAGLLNGVDQTDTPFANPQTLLANYNIYFEPLTSRAVTFIAPWLIHLFPAKDAGQHEELFDFLLGFLRTTKGIEPGFMHEDFSENERLIHQAWLLSNL